MTTFASAARRSRYVPLELKLPLLTITVLSTALAVTLWASYIEVRRAMLESARSHLEQVAQALAAPLERGTESTLGHMRDVAADPGLVAYLSGGLSTEAAARAALDRLTSASDSLVPAVILSRDGSPLLSSQPDAEADGGASDDLSAATAAAPAEGGYGPIFWRDGQAAAWATVPVMSAHERIGWVAQLHALDGAVRRPAFDSTTPRPAVRLASTPGEQWSTLDGKPMPAPPGWPFTGARAYEHSTGERRLAHATEVAGTAWSVVAEIPAAQVYARVRAFISRIVAAAAGIALIAATGSWVLGRALSRSIRRLRIAAQAIAAGNNGEPVMPRRGGELGVLAATLNDAITRVRARRRELEVQHGEARELAAALVHENAALERDLAIEKAAAARAHHPRRAVVDHLVRIRQELRAPVNAIVGYAELVELEVDGPLATRQRDQIARIRSSGERLLRLIDELVDSAATRSTVE